MSLELLASLKRLFLALIPLKLLLAKIFLTSPVLKTLSLTTFLTKAKAAFQSDTFQTFKEYFEMFAFFTKFKNEVREFIANATEKFTGLESKIDTEFADLKAKIDQLFHKETDTKVDTDAEQK